MDQDIQQRVNAAIKAGAPPDEAIRRGQALQAQRVAQSQQTTQSTDTTQQPQGGLLDEVGQGAINLVKDIAQPFIRTGKNIIAAPTEGVRALILNGQESSLDKNTAAQMALGDELAKTKDPQKKKQIMAQMRELSDEAQGEKKSLQNTVNAPSVLSKEDIQKIDKDPLGYVGQQAKDSIDIASYAVPFGKAPEGANILTRAATKALLPGATVGAAQALDEEDATPQSVVGGAIVGGATAGALHGIGGIISGASKLLSKGGSGANNSILNAQAEATPFYSEDIKTLENTAKELGLNNGSARARLDKMPGIFRSIEDQIKPQLEEVKTPVANDKVISHFDTNLSKNSTFAADDPKLLKARQEMIDRLDNLGGAKTSKGAILDAYGNPIISPTPPKSAIQLYNFKSELRGEITQALKKAEKGNLNLSPTEEAKIAMYSGLKDAIDDVAPDVRGLNKIEHYMFDLSKGLVKKSKEAGISLGAVKIPIPSQPVQAAYSALGSLMEGVGKVGEKGSSSLTSTLPQQAASRALIDIAGGGSQSQQNQNTNNPENHDQTIPQQPNNSQIQTQTPPESQNPYPAANYAADVARDPKNAAKYKAIYDAYQEAYGNQGKAVLSNAETNIDKMAELYGIGTNKSLSVGKNTVGLPGLLSRGGREVQLKTDQDYVDRLTAYKNMSSFAAGLLNQARGAGILNAGEYEVMQQNMPNEFSSEKAAQSWFNNMRDIIKRMNASGVSSSNATDIQAAQAALQGY